MDHSTHACQHNALKFCAHCNTVWCQACKAEWRQNAVCLLNHYPSYYTTTWPSYQFSGGIAGASSDLTITNATGQVNLATCAHGGD